MRVLVIAGDPGGAQSLIPVVHYLRRKQLVFSVLLENKSRSFFRAASLPYVDAQHFSDNDILKAITFFQPTVLLVGTSHGYESIEKRVYRLLQKHFPSLPVVAILDFWVNYKSRFVFGRGKNSFYYPHVICVMDDYAKAQMLADGIPGSNIFVTGNPHFNVFLKDISSEKEVTTDLLFIS